MSEELKACPFCGKEGEHDDYLAWCSDIECFARDINMPINEWNDRPIEDALRAQLAQAEKKLEVANNQLDIVIVESNTRLAQLEELIAILQDDDIMFRNDAIWQRTQDALAELARIEKGGVKVHEEWDFCRVCNWMRLFIMINGKWTCRVCGTPLFETKKEGNK